MRHDKIVPGAILITLGVIFLLKSLGVLHIHWMNILYLWPIFLLIGGINLIFANNRSVWAAVLKVGVVVLGLGILLFGNLDNGRYGFWPKFGYHYNSDNNSDNDNDNDDDDDDNSSHNIVKIEGNSSFNQPFDAQARYAKLVINGAASSYRLDDTTNQLFQAFTKEHGDKFQFSHSFADSVATVNFDMQDHKHIVFGRNKGNSATFKLNNSPIWDFDINVGAADINFDLTKFKVRNLVFNAGAASFTAKMGQPLQDTQITVSTGAAGVNISIPKDAACKIVTDSGLSSDDFKGFNKVSDDHYETSGYAAAKNKFNIKLDGAFTGFKVTRY